MPVHRCADDLRLRAAVAGEVHDMRTVLEKRILQVAAPRSRLEDRLKCVAMAPQANPLLDRAIFLIERERVAAVAAPGIHGEEQNLHRSIRRTRDVHPRFLDRHGARQCGRRRRLRLGQLGQIDISHRSFLFRYRHGEILQVRFTIHQVCASRGGRAVASLSITIDSDPRAAPVVPEMQAAWAAWVSVISRASRIARDPWRRIRG